MHIGSLLTVSVQKEMKSEKNFQQHIEDFYFQRKKF
jgi:hypothetical protein